MTSTVSLKTIAVESIDPHPQNPRAVMRQHVVDGIAQDIDEAGFDPCHALIVRPSIDQGRFEVISGHHRLAAAKQAGLDELPCWVRDLSDEDAFYALIRNNRQGELSPLEVGIHALDYVKLDKRGLGAEGKGLKAYAEGVGYLAASVTKYRNAASVYRSFISCNVAINSENINCNEPLLTKTNHLGEIHKADPSCWFILTSLMLEKGWTVKQTAEAVKRAQEFEIPAFWADVFLPLPLVVWRALDTREFSPKTVEKLIAEVETIEQRILTFRGDVAPLVSRLYDWLSDNAPIAAWDVRKVVEYGRILQAEAEAAEREEQERFSLGDWREHVDKLADGSVALLLTDPPYGMGYQSDYRLDRSVDRKHQTISSDAETESATKEIQDCFAAFMPKLKESAHVFCFCHWSNEAEIRAAIEAAGYTVRGSLIWVKNNAGMGDPKTTFAPKHERIIHAVKGSPVLFSRPADVLEADRCNSDRHPTEKPVALLKQLIAPTTTEHELIADPFAGVASTLVAAKEMNRAFFGCEVDEGYFNLGSDRL
jgi:DNA modification methylase